jgi:hypothetical protein
MKEWRFQSAERKDEKYSVIFWIFVIFFGCAIGVIVAILCPLPLIEVRTHPGSIDDSYSIWHSVAPVGMVIDRRSGIMLFLYSTTSGPYPEEIKRTAPGEWTVVFRGYKPAPTPDPRANPSD